MRPIPHTARKAGAVLAALMLSTALTACQPQASAASTAPPTSAPTPTAPASGSPGSSSNSTGSPGSSSGGSQSDVPQGLESFYSQTIDWKNCSDGTPFQCGTATVPLDYEHPDGRTITIALKKLPASDGNAEHGSLFTNPGGPGSSGVEPMKDPAAMPEELRGAYDIIGFDPRGVGQSTPITCWTNDEIKQSLTDPGNDATDPTDPLKGVTSKNVPAQDKIDRGAANAARCAQHSEVPELLDHVGTRNVARDLDVLRATNGNAKLNYLGTSYGTHIGAVYADLFPGRVGRTVLNAAMDPSRYRTDSDAEVVAFKEAALRQYVEHCQAQGNCPLTGSTDEAIVQLAAFVDGLDQDPLTAPGSSITVNTENATAIVQQYAVEKPDWDALTTMLAPAMNNHDGTLMVKATQNSSDLSPKTTVEEVVSSANNEVMFGAVICNDYPDTGGTASDWDAQAAAEKKTYPFFGGTSNAMEAYCRGWGHRAQTPPAQTHAKGSEPILVIGTTGDSRTLYPWAQSLTDQLDNGHLLTVKGYGHGASGSCAGAAMIDFLVNGTVPAEGTTCAAEPRQAAGGAEG
ncbi:alpha/beta hydrolase [Actinomyces sp. oral taxon 170]|uniref:alpha/beta hydrolase n=1 Tax=Actinomyces sp. oral taxon 170 TaxID=712117 RepID=UPI000205DB6F|nr:alpha/beta hydrolase [Actinomyces sp. oral taxon 170]EGF55900.1 TAP-like protein [Actinomyces sp. oral taxon 170 str. F0386]